MLMLSVIPPLGILSSFFSIIFHSFTINIYGQSMNVIAGTLLLFMEEEQAFWTFAYMVEGMLKNSYDKCN